jgi:hypothetical protein
MINLAINSGTKVAANLKSLDPTPSVSTDLLASSLLNRAPYFLGGLALLALIYSGFMYLTAFGDATKMEQAKKNISWTIIGIIAISAITVIIDIILRIVSATNLVPS